MKFIFEFVSCCGTPPRPAVLEEVPLPEESRTLEVRRRYRKERVGSSRSSSLVEWQPSLCSISEDNIVLEKEERPAESERTPKRKAASSTKIHVRSHSEDYGRSQISMMLPTFSPAPFMF
ncbi:hypothetical protein PVL29_025544 [Vitis rotundifolia]|uniref:Uncharacterized protein n=1 Tax=Vitis rotundifolia TaxID=103349 RepID=A0AA39D7D8_VITRO|nr:hypothetical protein PVL29_025544 [Vitis rotundifolia]